MESSHIVIIMVDVWWRSTLLVLTLCLTVSHCLESNQMLFSPPSQCWTNQSYSSVSLSCRDCQAECSTSTSTSRIDSRIG